MQGCNWGEIGYSLMDETPVSIKITKAGVSMGCLKIYFGGDLRETHAVSLEDYDLIDETQNTKLEGSA